VRSHLQATTRRLPGPSRRTRGRETGAIDHIAFPRPGPSRRPWRNLRRHKVEFSERRANGQALYQLFMYDPNGIKVELNFDAAEAQGSSPRLPRKRLAAR